MKNILFFLFLLSAGSVQSQTAKQLQQEAQTALSQGNFDKAIASLNKAKEADPGDVSILRDISYVYYMKRDFGAAIEAGKVIVNRPDADQQSFQVLGLSYKATANYKEAAKLYRDALRKFPNSGVIYNEYAELFALDKELDEAIKQWEKGIEVDPGYSGNYYNATMYHSRAKNWTRAMLYGELFLNLESYSARTAEIKSVLFDAWKNLLASGSIASLQGGRNSSAFEKDVLSGLAKASAAVQASTVTVENITAVRSRFVEEWMKDKNVQYPFRLFEHQQYLLKEGLFDAYNYWLFSSVVNSDFYKSWQGSHPKETEGFKKFQESRVFKVPAGQYYF
jgi:tetratricopeptide (TPR) repeat protein